MRYTPFHSSAIALDKYLRRTRNFEFNERCHGMSSGNVTLSHAVQRKWRCLEDFSPPTKQNHLLHSLVDIQIQIWLFAQRFDELEIGSLFRHLGLEAFALGVV